MVGYLAKYSVKNMWGHRRRNIVVLVVLFLVFFLLTESMFLYSAYKNMKLQDVYDNSGYYHLCVKKMNTKQREQIVSDSRVKRIGAESECDIKKVIHTETVPKNAEISFLYMDSEAITLNNFKLHCGRFPQKEGEIMVSAGMKKDGEYIYHSLNAGKKVSIKVLSEEGYRTYDVVGVLDDFNAGGQEECRLIAYKEKLITPDIYYVELVTSEREVSQKYLEEAGYHYEEDVYDVLNMLETGRTVSGEEYRAELNNNLFTVLERFSKAKGILIAAVVFVLLIGGFMLWSVFSIGLEETTKDNALLRMIGFSPGMLLLCNIMETSILAVAAYIIGIPMTIFSAGKIVEFAGSLRFSELSHIRADINVPGIIIAAVLVYVLAVACVVMPLIKYLKKSVTDMLRGDSAPVWSGKNKTGKHEKSFHGFYMGIRQTKRRPGRTISVILSLCSVFILLLVYIVCMNVIQDRMQKQTEVYRSQFSFFGDGTVDVAKEMEKVPYVTHCDFVKESFEKFDNKNIHFSESLKDKEFPWMEYDHGRYAQIEVVGISKYNYESEVYPREGYDFLDYKTLVDEKAGVIVDGTIGPDTDEEMLDVTFPLILKKAIKQKQKKTIKILSKASNIVRDASPEPTDPMILMPLEVYLEEFTPHYTLIFFNVEEEHIYDFREWAVEHKEELLPLTDWASEYMASRDTKDMLQGLLFAILVMVGTIALLTIINIFYANARMQRKDYAIMSALGMDILQMYMILVGEAFVYVAGAFLSAGLLAFICLKKLVRMLLQIEVYFNAGMFLLLGAIGISAFFLCLLLGMICGNQNRKHTVVSLLRNDSE